MSDQIREQVSAFLDGELPSSETELLLKRLTRDGELREGFGRYALIGEAIRGSTSHGLLTRGFAARVNMTIDGEPASSVVIAESPRSRSRWRPLGGVAMAAGVAAIAVLALQQRADQPNVAATARVVSPFTAPATAPAVAPATAPNAAPAAAAQLAANREALSYTTPVNTSQAPAALAPARLTNYVFAHSKYSSMLGQRDVLADMLIEDDDQLQSQSQSQAQPQRRGEAAPSAP